MSRTIKIVIAVVVVLALLGGGYLIMSKDDSNNQSSTASQSGNNETANKVSDDSKYEGTFSSISSSGKARQCTLTYSSDKGNGEGKVYTDGKGRGLMVLDVTTSNGGKAQINTLITADKAYSWTTSEGKSFGFSFDKTTITNTSSTSTTSSSTTSSQDANKNFSMQCSGWSVEESKLAPPSDVTFSSLPS